MYWGIACIFLILFVFGGNRSAVAPGAAMITIHLLFIHLFAWRGILMLKMDPVSFLNANWGSILFPYAGLAAVLLSERNRKIIVTTG
jgi:hypothetical protein